MTKTLLEKMFVKPDYFAATFHIPESLKNELIINQNVHKPENTKYNFILTFQTTKKKLEEEIPQLKQQLEENALLWVAYPKRKSLDTDLNRDILRNTMDHLGFTGVSLISLNETWSSMRFKQK